MIRNHALSIHVQCDNTALCFISSPTYGAVTPDVKNPVQSLTLNDGENRVAVAVTGRRISLEDIKRIARQAIERDFNVLA